jgi:hypothetical protein
MHISDLYSNNMTKKYFTELKGLQIHNIKIISLSGKEINWEINFVT